MPRAASPLRTGRGLARAIAGLRVADPASHVALAAWLRGDGSLPSFVESVDLAPDARAILARADRDAVLADLGARFPGVEPAFLAHELLLAAAGGGERARRGVFTTPRALADLVVASADRALREELGLAGGLADGATRGDVAGRVALPDGEHRDAPFVRVLDPAVGSGVFPVAVLRLLQRRDGAAGGDPSALLAERLVGFELLDAARAVAAANVAAEGGALDLRAANPLSDGLGGGPPFTVVVGNPPWSVRAGSLDAASRALVEPYRYLRGERIAEKGALRLEMHLQDDCVKFVRLAEAAIERAGAGVVALVTSHSWLDAPTLRGMRASLEATFDRLWVLDLHGSRLRRGARHAAAEDENLFSVGQGAAVLVGVRGTGRGRGEVHHGELVGPRATKLAALEGTTVQALAQRRIAPEPPVFAFVPRRRADPAWRAWPSVADLFPRSVSGIVTAHDRLVVGFGDAELRAVADVLLDDALGDEAVRARLGVRDNAGWKLARARERFRAAPSLEASLRDVAYRPFDARRLLYHPALVWCDRRRVMRDLDGGRNVALVVCRQLAAPPWRHVLATRELVDDNLVSNRTRERAHAFPLFLRAGFLRAGEDGPLEANVDPAAARALVGGRDVAPEELLAWVYARLHGNAYRRRHEEELAADFPRVPPARGREDFERLAELGAALLDAHTRPVPAAELATSERVEVSKTPTHDRGERLYVGPEAWINGVPAEVFAFRVGAYAPAAKWLRDRRGRVLDAADLRRYGELVERGRRTLAGVQAVDRAIG